MGKRRLDTLLAERGLFPSRSRAAASVMAGEVLVGAGSRRACKPGELVEEGERLSVLRRPQFVSRGGVKLANALDSCGLDVSGRRALDVGSSTGGFTDCLLQRGAREVICVDVGYGLLHYRLRCDERVQVLERTNARTLAPALLPAPAGGGGEPPDLAVVDVSFISLEKVLGAALGCLARPFDVLALVKPQFELGRGRVGKGGVVRNGADRREALLAVATSARELGAEVLGFHSSGLAGPKGNRETFLWLAAPSLPGASRHDRAAGRDRYRERIDRDRERIDRELERMAREVEP
ncbi:MAG TPA: TlyA family RNA methyltransferase [Solirubrobacteraceae bacterium]|nr:TlyA family RNA methyltransferase [Solirubrobacteraceae bacterium]